jgi:hypothetical protein
MQAASIAAMACFKAAAVKFAESVISVRTADFRGFCRSESVRNPFAGGRHPFGGSPIGGVCLGDMPSAAAMRFGTVFPRF